MLSGENSKGRSSPRDGCAFEGDKPLHSNLTRLAGGFIFCGMDFTSSRWLPIVLLTCSNIFMTVAWYGHLKFKDRPLLIVILVSWGIAFFEYCLQVPANRWGNSVYTATQ